MIASHTSHPSRSSRRAVRVGLWGNNERMLCAVCCFRPAATSVSQMSVVVVGIGCRSRCGRVVSPDAGIEDWTVPGSTETGLRGLLGR